MNLPDTITVTISEEARQSADDFLQRESCIIATQLKLDGFSDIFEAGFCTEIGSALYIHTPAGAGWTKDNDSPIKPHYGPEVVGKTLVLTKVK